MNILSFYTGTSGLPLSNVVALTLSFLPVPRWPPRSIFSPRTINFPLLRSTTPTAPFFAKPNEHLSGILEIANKKKLRIKRASWSYFKHYCKITSRQVWVKFWAGIKKINWRGNKGASTGRCIYASSRTATVSVLILLTILTWLSEFEPYQNTDFVNTETVSVLVLLTVLTVQLWLSLLPYQNTDIVNTETVSVLILLTILTAHLTLPKYWHCQDWDSVSIDIINNTDSALNRTKILTL